MNTIERMRERLVPLIPKNLEIYDESAVHAGHEGAKSGGGHYQMTIVSEQFKDRSTLARHRMIYAALADLMQKEIHALSIRAFTPEEM